MNKRVVSFLMAVLIFSMNVMSCCPTLILPGAPVTVLAETTTTEATTESTTKSSSESSNSNSSENDSLTANKVAYLEDALDSLIKVPISAGVHVEQIELNLLRLAALNKSIDVFSQDSIKDDLKKAISEVYEANMSDYSQSANTPLLGKNSSQIGYAMAALGLFSDSTEYDGSETTTSDSETTTKEDDDDDDKDTTTTTTTEATTETTTSKRDSNSDDTTETTTGETNVKGTRFKYETKYTGDNMVYKFIEAIIAKAEKFVEIVAKETNKNTMYTGLVYICDLINLCSEFSYDDENLKTEIEERLDALRNTKFKDVCGTEHDTLAEARDCLAKNGAVSSLTNTSSDMFENTASGFDATRLYQSFLTKIGDKNYYYTAEMLAGKALSAAYVPLRTNLYNNPYVEVVDNENFQAFNDTYGQLRKALYIATSNKAVSQYLLTSKVSAFKPAVLRDLVEDVDDEKLFVADPNYYNATRLEEWEFPGDDERLDFQLEDDSLYSNQETTTETTTEAADGSSSTSTDSDDTNSSDSKVYISEDGYKYFPDGTEITNGDKTFKYKASDGKWYNEDDSDTTGRETKVFYDGDNKGKYYIKSSDALTSGTLKLDDISEIQKVYSPENTYATLALKGTSGNEDKSIVVAMSGGKWKTVGTSQSMGDEIDPSSWKDKFSSGTFTFKASDSAKSEASGGSSGSSSGLQDDTDKYDKGAIYLIAYLATSWSKVSWANQFGSNNTGTIKLNGGKDSIKGVDLMKIFGTSYDKVQALPSFKAGNTLDLVYNGLADKHIYAPDISDRYTRNWLVKIAYGDVKITDTPKQELKTTKLTSAKSTSEKSTETTTKKTSSKSTEPVTLGYESDRDDKDSDYGQERDSNAPTITPGSDQDAEASTTVVPQVSEEEKTGFKFFQPVLDIFFPLKVFADENTDLIKDDHIKSVMSSDKSDDADEKKFLSATTIDPGVWSPIDNAVKYYNTETYGDYPKQYAGKYNIFGKSMSNEDARGSKECYSSSSWFTMKEMDKYHKTGNSGNSGTTSKDWKTFIEKAGSGGITTNNVAGMTFVLAYAGPYSYWNGSKKNYIGVDNITKLLSASNYKVMLSYVKKAAAPNNSDGQAKAVDFMKSAVASHMQLASANGQNYEMVTLVNNLASALQSTSDYTYDEKKEILIAAINACYAGITPDNMEIVEEDNIKTHTAYALLSPSVIAFASENWSSLNSKAQERIKSAYSDAGFGSDAEDRYTQTKQAISIDFTNIAGSIADSKLDSVLGSLTTKVGGTKSDIDCYIAPTMAMILHNMYINKFKSDSDSKSEAVMSDTTRASYKNFFGDKTDLYDKLCEYVKSVSKLTELISGIDGFSDLTDVIGNWLSNLKASSQSDNDTDSKLKDTLFSTTGSMDTLSSDDLSKYKDEVSDDAVKAVFKTWYNKKYKFELPINTKEQYTLLGSKLLRQQIDVAVTKNLSMENTNSYNEWYGIAFEFDCYNHPALADTIMANESKPIFRSSPNVVSNSTYMDYAFNYMLLKNMEEEYPIRWDSVLDLDSPIFVDIYGNIVTESGLVVIPFAANSTLHTKISLLNTTFLHSYGSAMSLSLSTNYLTEQDIAYIDKTYFSMNDNKIMNSLKDYPALSTAGLDSTNILIPDEDTEQWIINPIKIQTDVGNINLHKIETSDLSTAKVLYNLALSAYTEGVSDESIDVSDTYINVGHDIGSVVFQVLRGAPIEQIDYSVENIGSGINYDPSILAQAIKFERLDDQLKNTFQNSIITVPDLTTLPGIQYIIYFVYKILIIVFTLYLLLQVYVSASSQIFGFGTVFKITVAFAAIILAVFSLPFVYKYTYYYVNRALLQDEGELTTMLNLEKKLNNVELGITDSRNIDLNSQVTLKMHTVRTDYVSFLDKMRNAITASDVTSYFKSFVESEPESYVDDYELRGNSLYYNVDDLFETSIITVNTEDNTLVQVTTGTPAASFRMPYYAILDYLIYNVNSYNKLIDSYDYGTFTVGDGSTRSIGLCDRYFNSSAFRLTQSDVLNAVDDMPTNVDPAILIFATYDKAGMYNIYGRTGMDNRSIFSDRSSMQKCQWYADAINADELSALAEYLDNEAVSWIIKNEDMLCRVSDETILKSLALHLSLKYNAYLGVDGPKAYEIDSISTNDLLRLCIADRDGVMASSPYTYPKFVLVKSGLPGVYLGALLSLVTFLLAAAKPLATIITFFILVASLVILRVLLNIKTENLKGCIKLAVFLSVVNISYALVLKFMLILPDGIPSFIRIIFMIAIHMGYLAIYIWLVAMLVVNWKDCGSLAFTNMVKLKTLNIKTISQIQKHDKKDHGWDVYNRLKNSDTFRRRR